MVPVRHVGLLSDSAGLVDRLVDAERLGPLDGLAATVRRETAGLLAAGIDPLAVTAAITAVNDALTGRLLRLEQARLGPSPRAFAWLALGSHGRAEQLLSSDQDSALAYGGPPLRPGDPDAYFGVLTSRVVDALALAGLPQCTGGFMATSWRRPLEDYTADLARWVTVPDPAELVAAEVFLDVRPVHGDLDVSVLHGILESGRRHSAFLAQMARAAVAFRPPAVLWGHVRSDHGSVDLKRGGSAAIVLLARLHALAAGSSATSTAARLRDARAAGTLSQDGADALLDAHRLLVGLRLRHQVAQTSAGAGPDDLVSLAGLSTEERHRLVDALRTVRVIQEATAQRYQTRTLS